MGSHSDNNDIIVIIVTIRYCGQVCSLVPSLPPDTSERLQVIIFFVTGPWWWRSWTFSVSYESTQGCFVTAKLLKSSSGMDRLLKHECTNCRERISARVNTLVRKRAATVIRLRSSVGLLRRYIEISCWLFYEWWLPSVVNLRALYISTAFDKVNQCVNVTRKSSFFSSSFGTLVSLNTAIAMFFVLFFLYLYCMSAIIHGRPA